MPQSGEKEKALSYIAKCNKNRKAFAISLTENLGDEIAEEDLTEVMKQFFRSYDLRMSISGDKKPELEDQWDTTKYPFYLSLDWRIDKL